MQYVTKVTLDLLPVKSIINKIITAGYHEKGIVEPQN